MISYNGVWLELKDIERITSENSGPPLLRNQIHGHGRDEKTMIAS